MKVKGCWHMKMLDHVGVAKEQRGFNRDRRFVERAVSCSGLQGSKSLVRSLNKEVSKKKIKMVV